MKTHLNFRRILIFYFFISIHFSGYSLVIDCCLPIEINILNENSKLQSDNITDPSYHYSKLYFTDKIWVSTMKKYKNSQNDPENYLSYNNASVKGMRSKAILYRDIKPTRGKNGFTKKYHILMTTPLRHFKTLNIGLKNDIFTFKRMREDVFDKTCDYEFISYLWVTYGNFEYIENLDPNKKDDFKFLITSDVFSEEGRTELHSEFLRSDLELPIRSVFEEILGDSYEQECIFSNVVKDDKKAPAYSDYRIHFNNPEYDFKSDPKAPLMLLGQTRTFGFSFNLAGNEMYLNWENRARNSPFIGNDNTQSSPYFSSCNYSYYDQNGLEKYYGKKTTPVGSIVRGNKFNTFKSNIEILNVLKGIISPKAILDLAVKSALKPEVRGVNDLFICMSDFRFIINPCETGIMPDVNQPNKTLLKEVKFIRHANFVPWVIMAGTIDVKSGLPEYIDNYSLDFKPDRVQFQNFEIALRNIQSILSTKDQFQLFGPYTYVKFYNTIKWSRANFGNLTNLRFLKSTALNSTNFLETNATNNSRLSSENYTTALSIATSVSDVDNNQITGMRIELSDYSNTNIINIPSTRTENLFISKFPEMNELPQTGQIKVLLNTRNNGEIESSSSHYAIFNKDVIRTRSVFSTSKSTFGIELSNCSKETLDYILLVNQSELTENELYGRRSDLIKIKTNNSISGMISIAYIENNSNDLLDFVQTFLGVSEATNVEDYLKIFSYSSQNGWEELEDSYIDKENNMVTAQLPPNSGSLTFGVFPSALPNISVNIPELYWSIYPKPNESIPIYATSLNCGTNSRKFKNDTINESTNYPLFVITPVPVAQNNSVRFTKFVTEDIDIEVFNSLGKLVFSKEISQKETDINIPLVAGVYFVKAKSNTGKNQVSKILFE